MRLASAESASRSASLVPVLPTEPVTAMTLALLRARAARARSRKASSTSSTTSSGASAAKRARLRARDHGEAGARLERGVDEIVAVAVVALDGEEGLAAADAAAVDRKPRHVRRQRAGFVARAWRRPWRRGSTSALMPPSPAAPPRPPRGRRTATSGRRRSGRFRGPCRRSAARRRASSSATAVRIASRAVADLGGARRRGEDGGADRGRLLAARIVVGDDDAVGVLRRDARPSAAACP